MNKEPMKLTKSRIRRPEAVSFRTGTMEKRAEVGKGGQETGKWRSFSHFETALTRLFPRFSTQVVDFPRIEHVSQAELGTNMGKTEKNHRNKRGWVQCAEAELI
jgi:hypothetical protein